MELQPPMNADARGYSEDWSRRQAPSRYPRASVAVATLLIRGAMLGPVMAKHGECSCASCRAACFALTGRSMAPKDFNRVRTTAFNGGFHIVCSPRPVGLCGESVLLS